MRLYVDVTPVMRDRLGCQIFQTLTSFGEARTSVVVSRLAADPRLTLRNHSRVRTLRRILAAFVRVGIPPAALRVMLSPFRTRMTFIHELESIARVNLPPHADASARLDAFERLVLLAPRRCCRACWASWCRRCFRWP